MRSFTWSILLILLSTSCSSSSSSGGDDDAGDDVLVIGDGGDAGDGTDGADGEEDAATDGSDALLVVILAGEDDDDGWAAIPEIQLPPPDEAHIVSDEAMGMVDNRLVLWLTEEVTVGEVNSAISGLDLTVIGGEPTLGWLVAEVAPDLLESAVAQADASDAFEVVNLDLIYPSQSLAPAHSAPDGLDGDGDFDGWEWETLDKGANWGLKFIHAPAAWNLRPLMQGPADAGPYAVVIDNTFPDHADVSFTDSRTLGPSGENPHGTAVATIMAAHWDDVGIEGVFPADLWIDEEPQSMGVLPLRSTSSMGNVQGLTDALLTAALDEQPLVANQSLGTNYFGGNRDDGFTLKEPDDYADWSFNTYADLNARDGRAFAALARRFERRHGFSRWLLVCSAGNSNIDAHVAERTDVGPRRFTAEENSGCGWASANGHSHFMAIENLAPPGDVLDHVSHRDGTLSAPGNAIGQASSNGGYRAEGGTSFAAPMVAGSALVLWSLAPDATHGQILDALVRGARPAVEDSAPRLDLWGAIEILDGLDDELGLLRYAADLDDGTADGALRVTPGDVVNETVAASGDKCIDLADFRALRDAIIDGRSVATWSTALDGDKEHVKRDLNRDGGFNYVSDSDALAPEGYFARHDLNGDGQLTDADMQALAEVWGTCWDDSGPANTRGMAAADLVNRIASLDIWVDLSTVDQITVTATGSSPVSLGDGVVDTVEDHAVVTVPFDPCGDFVVRTTQVGADGGVVHRQWRPEGEVEAGNDLVLGEGSAADIDRTTPLAFYQAAGGVSWILLYDGTPPTEIQDPGAEMSVSPEGILAFQGDEAIDFATATKTWNIDISGTNDEFIPWQWSANGRALLALNVTSRGFEDDLYAYVDLDREQGWLLDPDTAPLYGDWPTIDRNGVIWMTGNDHHIYTITPPPLGIQDWDAFIDELIGLADPTCSFEAGPALPDLPAVQFDDLSGYSRVRLARAEPTAVSDTGFVAAVGERGEVVDLLILSPDGTRATVIKEAWTPRGANDTGFLGQVPDYVSWSRNGEYLAFGETDGIYVANLGDSYWEFPSADDISTSRVSERLGAVAFAPIDDRLIIVESGGTAPEPRADVTVVTASGTEVVTYAHGPRYGFPAWSGSGAQLVVTDPEDLLTRPDIRVVSAYRDQVFFETHEWRSESGGRSNDQYPSWGRGIRGY